jgi:vitamin B12 transporter
MKKDLFAVIGLVSLAFAPAPALAQNYGDADEMNPSGQPKLEYHLFVTANRAETSREEVGSSITVISARQLEEMQKFTVLDALRTVPGLDVVQTGGPGGQTSVLIRGAKSEDALILLDGVEMNDPSTPGRSFDFAHLTTADIERIEIIRGPQSTLYGSDAMSGVINIISKTGQEKTRGFLSGEYGSFDSFSGNAGLSGGNKWADYALSASRLDSKGISAASAGAGNMERDGYENTTISGKLGITPVGHVHADFILRYIDSQADLDNAGGVGGDDPNNRADVEQLSTRAQARISLFNGFWQQTIGFSLSRQERNYRNDTDAAHPVDLDRSSYSGQILKFDWQHNFCLQEANMLTVGLETEREKGESAYYSESAWGPYASEFTQKNARTTAGYIQDHLRLGGNWFATLGARLDDHNRFGTKITYRIASTYLIQKTGTRIKGTYGTGFKSPSLYQLYSFYGDETLKPETSLGWDIGIEQSFCSSRLTLGATYFNNQFDRMIDYDNATWKYVNVGRAKTRGIEMSASGQPLAALVLQASYTYTATEDEDSGLELLRRARHKMGFTANCRFSKKGNANLEIAYVGKRTDIDYSTWPNARVSLAAYVLLNLATTYDLSGRVRIGLGVKNLGNVKYEEILGYGTPGISAYLGVKFMY